MCWGVEKCRKRCGRKCFEVPHASHTLPPPIHPNTLSNTFPNTSSYPTISTYLPRTPTHFPTPPPTLHHTPHLPLPLPHPNTLPYTSPHISLYLSHISFYLPHIPTPFSTPPPILLHISLHLSHTLTHFPTPYHSILTPYTMPATRKHI